MSSDLLAVQLGDLVEATARRHPDRPAMLSWDGQEWVGLTFDDLRGAVDDVAAGLCELGIGAGDRVAVLSASRPEWGVTGCGATAAGCVTVTIYPTNSPEECRWVLGDSGARMVVCEDAEQVQKVAQVRDDLPDLQYVVVIDPEGSRTHDLTLAALRSVGTEAGRHEAARRRAATSVDDTFLMIYTSGTTGPPKGCVLTHGNYRWMLQACRDVDLVCPGELTYLYLPLAHSFAQLMQLVSLDRGGTVAFASDGTNGILDDVRALAPHVLPTVPRILEKLFASIRATAANAGVSWPELGELDPEEIDLDPRLVELATSSLGGRVRQVLTGAAPVEADLLRFWWAAGVPIIEGYGMTETSTVTTISRPDDYRIGTVGKPLPGVDVRIADDGEVLVRGPNVFRGYHGHADTDFGAVVDGWLATGDLGALDDDGFLRITGRKKDIIITAGGKNISHALIEVDLAQTTWISRAVVCGDRRPYCVALLVLDEGELARWAREHDHEAQDLAVVARLPEVRALVQEAVDDVNRRHARVAQIKRFAVLDQDLSQELGELTPTMKVRRPVVQQRHADLIEHLYQPAPQSEERP